jgi:DNA invertase Pin-like site-specific DNA recombinase
MLPTPSGSRCGPGDLAARYSLRVARPARLIDKSCMPSGLTFTCISRPRHNGAGRKGLFQMMGILAEFERSMIQERVRAGLARARAEARSERL